MRAVWAPAVAVWFRSCSTPPCLRQPIASSLDVCVYVRDIPCTMLYVKFYEGTGRAASCCIRAGENLGVLPLGRDLGVQYEVSGSLSAADRDQDMSATWTSAAQCTLPTVCPHSDPQDLGWHSPSPTAWSQYRRPRIQYQYHSRQDPLAISCAGTLHGATVRKPLPLPSMTASTVLQILTATRQLENPASILVVCSNGQPPTAYMIILCTIQGYDVSVHPPAPPMPGPNLPQMLPRQHQIMTGCSACLLLLLHDRRPSPSPSPSPEPARHSAVYCALQPSNATRNPQSRTPPKPAALAMGPDQGSRTSGQSRCCTPAQSLAGGEGGLSWLAGILFDRLCPSRRSRLLQVFVGSSSAPLNQTKRPLFCPAPVLLPPTLPLSPSTSLYHPHPQPRLVLTTIFTILLPPNLTFFDTTKRKKNRKPTPTRSKLCNL